MIKIHVIILSFFLLITFAQAQEPLLPEPEGIVCEDATKPLDPDSREAREMLDSDDFHERECALLRIELHEQELNGIDVAHEELIEPVIGINDHSYLQSTLLNLLNALRQLLGEVI